MRKIALSLITCAVALLWSCNGQTTASTDNADTTATQPAVAEAVTPQPEQPVSLADLVEKAKAEGASWSTDEWKAQYKKVLEAYKPFAVAMNEAQPADLEKMEQQYGQFPALIKEFAAIAKQSEGGKAIDDQWIADTMQEMGVPHL